MQACSIPVVLHMIRSPLSRKARRHMTKMLKGHALSRTHREPLTPMQSMSSESISLESLAASVSRLEKQNAALRKKLEDMKPQSDFTLAVLGDLHLNPQTMQCHLAARAELKSILADSSNPVVVSVGDLGDKYENMVYPDGQQASAGSSASFSYARDFLDGFDHPYELITGNHDLEGLTEFASDEANLEAWMTTFGKQSPYFSRIVAHKTLLLGLSTTRFRSAISSSHEVYIDDVQLRWFEQQLQMHPAKDGWRVLVFTHAPPMGSQVRAIQSVHIKNGCAWLNHSDNERRRREFLRLVHEHACIRAWFSGHFHLCHDYEDALGWSAEAPVADAATADPASQGWPHRGCCLFVQLGVIGESSQRDGRRQSRIVRGTAQGLEILTVNHHEGGRLRTDAILTYGKLNSNGAIAVAPSLERILPIGEQIRPSENEWFSARTPRPNDGCYLELAEKRCGATPLNKSDASSQTVCWWHMTDGAVLGVHDNMLIEYDGQTLSPLGVVVEDLGGSEVFVIGGGAALVLQTHSKPAQVIHPNEDGSYWRKFQKNKLYRNECKKREQLLQDWCELKQKSKSVAPSPAVHT